MKRKLPRLVLSCFLAIVLAGGPYAVAEAPRGISPGRAAGPAAVATPCPTFSWTAVDAAEGYELVVYETGEIDRSPARQPVIRTRIAGKGSSWTPSAEGCLKLFDSYVWSVRALDASGEGEWSEGLLFEVEAGPFLEQVGGVLERALAAYLGERGVRFEPDGGLALALAEELSGARVAGAERTSRTVLDGRGRHAGRGRASAESATRGVFSDEVELWLEESGSGEADKVQLVFATPEFDGEGLADAWAIVVEAYDTVHPDDGKMIFSTPSFFDPLQLFTDGTAIIGDLREFRILPSLGPPIGCTALSLQGGMLYYDSDLKALCVCDGSGSWKPVDSDVTGSCV